MIELTPIGRVESDLTDRASAPKQGLEGAPDAWLIFEPAVLDALDGIGPGAELIVLTWLDRARRDVLRVHPRDDRSQPHPGRVQHALAGSSEPDRAAPGRGRGGRGPRLRVRNLEAIDGTPIVDVKPVLRRRLDT